MKKSSIIVMMALAASFGTAAMAKDDDKSDKADKADKDRVICKTEKITGSLTRKRRTCLTAEQWEQLASSTTRDVQDFQRSTANSTASAINVPSGS